MRAVFMIKILDFYADWCGPCRAMEPIIKEIEKELSGKAEFEKIDIDKDPDTPAKYSVMHIPTFVVLKNGKEIDRIVGSARKDEFRKLLEAHI